MRVSVIIPNFNKGAYISDTLFSVITQSYHDWEILVIDDHSTDQSLVIIDSIVKKYDCIKRYKNNSGIKGASACRNIGLEKARGNYIVFLDSDDLLLPHCLQQRVEKMESDQSLDFAVFSMGTFYNNIGDNSSVWIPPRTNHLNRFLSHELPWSIVQPIWKKEFLKRLGGFNTSYQRLQDVELHTRALLHEDTKYRVYPEQPVDCYYRIAEKRMISGYQAFFNNWIQASLYYVKEFSEVIKSNKKKGTTRIKALRGTIFAIINQILVFQKANKLSKNEADQFVKLVLKDTTVKALIPMGRLLIYMRFFHWGFYHIKGFNYLSKKMILW